jgi:acyl carrier protein
MSAAEVRTIIAKIMGRDVVEDTDDPIKDYGADSLDMLELTQTLEDRFGYHIPDDEVDQLRTVGDFSLVRAARCDGAGRPVSFIRPRRVVRPDANSLCLHQGSVWLPKGA